MGINLQKVKLLKTTPESAFEFDNLRKTIIKFYLEEYLYKLKL
jgi:hypothetical protein